MKVGFYLDNTTLSTTDFRHPELGNPGTGAAAYLHVALPYFIGKYSAGAIETHIFAQHTGLLPEGIPCHAVDDVRDAANKAKASGMDIFVFRPRVREENHILDLLDELDLPSIGRAALTPSPEHVRRMSKSSAFKALVCVGRQQYDSLIDSPLYSKLVQINNGLNVASCRTDGDVPRDSSLVVYMGALVPQKGFHLLAEAWPRVVERVPHAKLSVIGSPKIYDETASLGSLGVADAEFERRYIVPNLTDGSGVLHPSVTFHGKMGTEKYDLLNRALVGVPNPSGRTETFCVCAAEMSASGAAVVSGAYYGLLDTVEHGVTGLLGRTVSDLASNIIHLLENPNKAKALGEAGQLYAFDRFDFSVVSQKWVQLFVETSSGNSRRLILPTKNLGKHLKLLRVINVPFQRVLGRVLNWPSVQEIEHRAKSLKGKFSA